MLKDLDYIFELSEFKLGCGGGFAVAVMNSETAYILAINNTDHDIIVLCHQCLGKAFVFTVKGCYHASVEDRYLANGPISIKKGLTVAAVLLMMPMLQHRMSAGVINATDVTLRENIFATTIESIPTTAT